MSQKKKKNANYQTASKIKEKEKLEKERAEKKKNLIITISTIAVAVVFLVSVIGAILWSSFGTEQMGTGASEYLETRDTTGRDIKYVEMCVEDYGKLVILLDATTAPKTVENFLSLVRAGFYDGLTFHRVIENFMIQGGDPRADGTGKGQNTIVGEFDSNGHINDIKHLRGVISMARGNYPDSASCQFFICNADSPHLNGDYAAFGYVVEGMSVIDDITEETVKYTTGGVIRDKSKQAVIKYIKVLDSWEKP